MPYRTVLIDVAAVCHPVWLSVPYEPILVFAALSALIYLYSLHLLLLLSSLISYLESTLGVPYRFFLYPRFGVSSSLASHYYYYLLFLFTFRVDGRPFFCFFLISFLILYLPMRGGWRFSSMYTSRGGGSLFFLSFPFLFPLSIYITKTADRGRRHEGSHPHS